MLSLNKIAIIVLVVFWFMWCFIIFGSTVEQDYYPVRINQSIYDIEYDKTKGYFCWKWYSDKIRSKPGKLYVTLKNQDHPDGLLFSTYNKLTFLPWRLDNPAPTSQAIQPLCIFIPPESHLKSPFSIHQYLTYPGLLGLWTLQTHVPTIDYNN